MEFKNLSELKARWYLELWDIIFFKEDKYKVNPSHLYNTNGSNDEILTKYIKEDKHIFASRIYGYTTTMWIFPNYDEFDYKSAYNIAVEMYEEIEKVNYIDVNTSTRLVTPLSPLVPITDFKQIREWNYIIKDKTTNKEISCKIEKRGAAYIIISKEQWEILYARDWEYIWWLSNIGDFRDIINKWYLFYNPNMSIAPTTPVTLGKPDKPATFPVLTSKKTKAQLLEKIEEMKKTIEIIERQRNEHKVEIEKLRDVVIERHELLKIADEKIGRLIEENKKITTKFTKVFDKKRKKNIMLPSAWDDIVIEQEVYKKLKLSWEKRIPLLLQWQAGTGKSSTIKALANELWLPIYQFNFNWDTTVEHLLGHKVLTGNPKNPMEFEYWPLALAVKNWWIFLADELNASNPEIQFILNWLLENKDWKLGTLSIQGNNWEVLVPHKDFMFYGTFNPNYLGTKTFSTSLMSRFIGLKINPLLPSDEVNLLAKKFPKVNKEIIWALVELETQLRADKNFSYDISTRDLVQCLMFIDWGFSVRESIDTTVSSSLQLDLDLITLEEKVSLLINITQ